jgi:hypothetical protein
VTTQYVVVSGTVARGHTLYGPFPSVDAAQAWANHPYRVEETRARFEVLPLFGGLMVEPEPTPMTDDDRRAALAYADADAYMRSLPRWTGVARP